MPAALQGLMGEANLRYARREYEEAIKMCMEIIRQFPHSPEPYQVILLFRFFSIVLQKHYSDKKRAIYKYIVI